MSTHPDELRWNDLRLERQVWLVCAPEATRRSRRWYDQIGRIMLGRSFRGVGLGTDLSHRARDARLTALQFAAEELAGRLTPAERAELAQRRVLPGWFVPEMVERAKEIDRELRAR